MKTHKNRVPTRPNRRKITPENGAAYYAVVERADEPTEEGTVVNKEMLDEFLAASGATAGSGTAFTLAQDGFSLFDGALVRIKLNRDMVAGATLNVNGTGAKAIVDAAGNAVSAGAVSGSWLDMIYNGSRWVLLGGDTSGCAQASYPVAQAVMAGEIVDIVGGKATKQGNLQNGVSGTFATDYFRVAVAALPGSKQIVTMRTKDNTNGGSNAYILPSKITTAALVAGTETSLGVEYKWDSGGWGLYNIDDDKILVTRSTEQTSDGETEYWNYFYIIRWDGSKLVSICRGSGGKNAKIVKMSSSKAFVWYYGTMREVTLGSTTASLGSTITLSSAFTPSSIDALSSTAMIAVNDSGKAAVLTVSGSSITTGTQYTFSTVSASAKVVALSSTRAAVVYGNKARVLTVSGTTITMGPELTFCATSLSSTSDFAVDRLYGNVVCIAYVTTGINVVLCDATTTTITKKAPVEIVPSRGTAAVDAVGVNDNTMAIVYNANSSASGTCVVQLAMMSNVSTEGIAMQTVSSGNVPVCFDGNISLPGKTRGQEIRSFDGQLVGHCYADGKVNVIGSWKR